MEGPEDKGRSGPSRWGTEGELPRRGRTHPREARSILRVMGL